MAEPLIFLLMLAVFIFLAMVLRWPIGVSLALSALAGSLASGHGLGLRHLVEGSFGYFDTILIILTATIFMKVLEATGFLDTAVAALLRALARRKALLLLVAMVIVMFPGMITGSSTAAILTSGPLIAPVLMRLGLPRLKTAAFIAMGGILGMIAPPVNILIMIMGAGVDMPYTGVTLPLLLIVIPLVPAVSLWLGYKDLRTAGPEELKQILPASLWPRYGARLIFPLLVVFALMIAPALVPGRVPDIGIPAVFLAGSLAGIFCGRRFNFLKVTQKAVAEALPILAILAGVGMFIQIMTLTGARGWLVISILSLPSVLLYLGISLSMPLFGGVSTFGSASILGVPFILALINKNALLSSSALSAIAGLGDLVPPAAISLRFSAQVAGERDFFKVLKYCLVPALFQLALGIGMLLAAPLLDKLM